MPSPSDDERLIAAVELVGRTGAKHFQVGYLYDHVPVDQADWYAHAAYRGARITEQHHASPVDAAEALARRLLTGARCTCGKLVALELGGAFAFKDPVMADGSRFPVGEAARAGLCRWQREGPHWVSGCGLRGERKARG